MSTETTTLDHPDDRVNWISSIPFFAMHLACFAAFFLPVRPVDVAVAVGLYVLRMWGITAGFHRYFSHRAYQTGRVFQFILAWVGTMSAQKGVLWWAANHRHHHRYLGPGGRHPLAGAAGLLVEPRGLDPRARATTSTRYESIRDFARYPELVWLNTWYLVPPTVLGVVLFLVGGWSMLVWGLCISTVALWHGTFTINSLSHVFGRRRYRTTDTSRNNWLLALITLGEGWHNNHHFHQNTANQGWFWWEVDLSYYSLKVLSWFGVVKALRKPSAAVRDSHLRYSTHSGRSLRDESRWLRRATFSGQQVRETLAAAGAAPGSQGGARRRQGAPAGSQGDARRRQGALPDPKEVLAAAAEQVSCPGSAGTAGR